MRKVLLLPAALLAFLGTLLWRAPASWLNRALPAQVQCAGYDGTLWNGRCMQLNFDGLKLGQLSWQLRALPLLLGRLSLQFTARAAQLDLRGQVQVRSDGGIAVSELSGQTSTQLLGIPLPHNVRGNVRFENVSLTLRQRSLTHLAGQSVLTDLSGAGDSALGEYQLQFPDAGADNPPFNGRLRDRSGPFALSAALRISADMTFDLEGSVALRQNADPQLAGVLDWAGPADADGVHPLSVAGRF
ncbi:MAG: type II secretion system protein N [Steroidobacteraceae bacterium]